MTYGIDTSFLLAVEIVEHAHHAEADQVLATNVAIALFHTWMRRHQLGRKRVLDTLPRHTVQRTSRPF